ncbi:hypothetical protein RF11_12082 [Thelohanellus kitauei]|uniref:Uncharacterized protein n=1 Tax=Thelohanellus kitauei TaxID=669202 RepID=A0A0C2JGX1_THEKT|nr:hypothetical protein RF11_12082 [Thelohanellus kitauei]
MLEICNLSCPTKPTGWCIPKKSDDSARRLCLPVNPTKYCSDETSSPERDNYEITLDRSYNYASILQKSFTLHLDELNNDENKVPPQYEHHLGLSRAICSPIQKEQCQIRNHNARVKGEFSPRRTNHQPTFSQ